MKTHNFIVASTRPDLLVRQVVSFANVRHGRQLKFYVFNDTDTRDDEFEIAINELRSRFEPNTVGVHYVSLQRQVQILQDFSRHASLLTDATPDTILECFSESGKMQGIRSIQNKSILIFYLLNKDKGSIIHKIDDDIVAVNAQRTGQIVEISNISDYFTKKELSLGDDPNLISGSDYSIDTPSPLVELADFVDFYYNFFLKTLGASENQVIGDDYLAINPAQVLRYNDPNNYLDIVPPSCDSTYGQIARQIKAYVKMLDNGRSRITINDTSRYNIAKDTFFPGGCNSINYSYQPGLTPLFGNQDLLWELFEFQRGKKLTIDGYVGHIKVHSNRKPLLEDLTDVSYKHQTKLTYGAFAYLSEHCKSPATDAFNQQFIAQSDQWLNEVDEFVHGIMDVLRNKNQWLQQELYASDIDELQSFLSAYLSKKEEIRNNYSHQQVDGREYVNRYFEMNNLFTKLIDLAKSSTVVSL